MSAPLPLPTIDFEIVLSTSGIHINMNPGVVLGRYRTLMELGDSTLAVAWVLQDVLSTLDKVCRSAT